jgi:alkyldihydroxyacetonephosphate synthase
LFFPDWDKGLVAVRKAVQAKISLSMLRLSSATETQTQLAMAGHERLVRLYERWLARRGCGSDKCLLIFGVTGARAQFRTALKQATRVFKGGTGFHTGKHLGRKWAENRFRTPYLRNTLWEWGYAVDTLETATDWQKVDHMVEVIESSLHSALEHEEERVHVFTHLSHVYPQGASVYTTFIFRRGGNYDITLARWQALKGRASRVIIENGGTISHQHGVGRDHAPYLPAEKGELGIKAIQATLSQFDPEGMMNPGKLVP